MHFEFDGEMWYWRGPAPFYFVTVPEKECQDIKAISSLVTYGWGMIPARVGIGAAEYKTSLWPKNGLYIVPIRAHVRESEHLKEGDIVTVRLDVDV